MKVMEIQKFVILKKYLEWVDQVSEDIEDKSSFEPTEIVFKICDIIKEEQNRKAAMLNPPNLDDILTKQDRGVCKDCYYAGAFTCEH